MQTLQFKDVPLWSHTTGSLVVSANVPSASDPLPVSGDAIESAAFDAAGNFTLGGADSVKLGVTAHTGVKLAALFKEQTGAAPDLVTEFAIAPSLTDTNLALALEIGANASLSAQGSYRYSVLEAGATLDAGIDGRLVHVRTFDDRKEPGLPLLARFIATVTAPAAIQAPPPPGQVTAVEFGGFLKFAANAAAGYQLKGTQSIDVGKLNLSEHYDLSVTGKLSVSASLAGRFSVEVRRADDRWASVTVRRKRSKDLTIGADLSVGAQIDTQGLPASGKEFLEALIGVRAKNWLNQAIDLVDQAAQIRTAKDLTDRLDGLADIYISRFVDKAVADLLPAEVEQLMGRLQEVVKSYRNVENYAIALYDHYADGAGHVLKTNLEKLRGTADLSKLQGAVDPVLWAILQQLTGGNPLDWIVGAAGGSAELQSRVDNALSLLNDAAHAEIRQYIGIAKTDFGLDALVGQIERVDTKEALAATLSDVAKHQLERLIGIAINEKLKPKDLQRAFDTVQQIKQNKDAFFARFDEVLKEAASQSYKLDFNAAYSRSDESQALIDLDIRLLNDDGSPCEEGRRLMQRAGLGDFQEILARYDPAVVRLRSGALTHKLSSSTGVTINIAGWHRNFQYQDMSKVVVQSDQQIRPTSGGMINVFTTVDLSVERQRSRKTSKSEQLMHSNFTLRFLAETNNVVDGSKFDQRNRQYMLDVITGQSAVYSRILKDSNASTSRLQAMLSFAATLGLDQTGATLAALGPLLKVDQGSFGPADAEYTVRFADEGLAALFRTPFSDAQIRQVLRAIVVANYAADPGLAPVAWMFTSDKARDLALGNPNFLDTVGVLQAAIDSGQAVAVSPIEGVKPQALVNRKEIKVLAATLFRMEDSLVRAFQKLESLVRARKRLSLADLEKSLDAFGHSIEAFDEQASLSDASVSPAFAVFDYLIQLASAGKPQRSSALALTVGDGKDQHQFLFQLGAGQQKAAAA